MEWIIFLVLAPIFLIIMSNGRKKQECEKWNAQYANYVKRCKSKGETPKSQGEYERDEKREIEKMQREITALTDKFDNKAAVLYATLYRSIISIAFRRSVTGRFWASAIPVLSSRALTEHVYITHHQALPRAPRKAL